MLEKLKGLFGGSAKEQSELGVPAPVSGTAVPLKEVPDPTFSEEMLGKGGAILPTSGKIVSPVAGKVLGIFKTSHAVTLQAENGAEILIHIGLDTVKLAGECFTPHVTKGQQVQPGDLLIEADLEGIKAAGYNTITAVLVCNTEAFSSVTSDIGPVEALTPFIRLKK